MDGIRESGSRLHKSSWRWRCHRVRRYKVGHERDNLILAGPTEPACYCTLVLLHSTISHNLCEDQVKLDPRENVVGEGCAAQTNANARRSVCWSRTPSSLDALHCLIGQGTYRHHSDRHDSNETRGNLCWVTKKEANNIYRSIFTSTHGRHCGSPAPPPKSQSNLTPIGRIITVSVAERKYSSFCCLRDQMLCKQSTPCREKVSPRSMYPQNNWRHDKHSRAVCSPEMADTSLVTPRPRPLSLKR